MDSFQSLLQDSINHLKSNPALQHAKPVIYIGLALVAFAYLIERAVINSKQRSRLPSRSPDPEKPRYVKEKALERPPGGESICTPQECLS